MKKRMVFTVLLAMVFALSFAWTAMAADDACQDCGKCPLGQIECCTVSGQTAGATYFDYETRHGYCDDTHKSACKVVFNLCECDAPNTNFVSGKEIGVHMTILNTGVYFTSEPVYVYAWTGKTPACNTPLYMGTDTVLDPASFGGGLFYFKHTFSGLLYYDRAGVAVTTPMTPAQALAYNCEVPCDKYASELLTTKTGSWALPALLVSGEYKYWFVDIPNMVINWAEVQGREGEVVRVEVCLQGATGGICRDCEDICCCIIEVGTLCCQTGDQTCIYFPYVVSQISPWWTGIAITNRAGNASLDLTLTLTDMTGAKFIWQKDNHTATVWAFILDAVLANFTGTGTPAAGAAMLEVRSNEGFIDGYSFLTDGNFGGSTLARGCCAICYVPKSS